MDEDDYLQKITELVYDDNKIVTPTTLSKLLDIKIQDSQNLLDKYVRNADVPNQTDLSWTFLLIGINFDKGTSILVSKQEDLNDKKSKLKEIKSEHVYSIQRNGKIDVVALANVEPFTESEVCSVPLRGAVVSRNAVKRKLKDNLIVANDPKPVVNKQESKQNGLFESGSNKGKKNGIESFCSAKGTVSNSQPKPPPNVKSKQKNMMANFFSKSPKITQDTNEKIDKEKLIDNTQNVKETPEIDPTEQVEQIDKMEVDNEPFEKIDGIDDASDLKKGTNYTEKTKSKAKKGKKRKSENKSNQSSKKRKRIIEAGDSDSDIFASSESEIEVVPDIHYSDDDQEVNNQPEPTMPSKARRMKQTTEEFMDEDGYMNTVQKYVFVSDDEDEAKEQKPINVITEKLPAVKKETAPISAKKENSPKKGNKNGKGKAAKTIQNQPSIMSFFKKT